MSRGGKRPGAGAQKGNLNALRTGQYSERMRELLDDVPEGFFIMTKKGGMVFIHKKGR